MSTPPPSSPHPSVRPAPHPPSNALIFAVFGSRGCFRCCVSRRGTRHAVSDSDDSSDDIDANETSSSALPSPQSSRGCCSSFCHCFRRCDAAGGPPRVLRECCDGASPSCCASRGASADDGHCCGWLSSLLSWDWLPLGENMVGSGNRMVDLAGGTQDLTRGTGQEIPGCHFLSGY